MRHLLPFNIDRYRYERKFFVEGRSVNEIELGIKLHPAVFCPIFYPRKINNIYFDSVNMDHYNDNVNGMEKRFKVRVRWYGDTFGNVKEPQLEIKIKNNMHVGKVVYQLRPFTIDDSFSRDDMRDVFRDSELSEQIRIYLKNIEPILLNSYDRKYYLSGDGKYRITVDNTMKVYHLDKFRNNFLNYSENNEDVILELKYDDNCDENAEDITNHLPFRMTKSSKYVSGVESLMM